MAMVVKIPVPQSGIMYDPQTGRPTREWYQYWENLGTVTGPLASLPLAKIWIGNAAGNPVAHSVSGDITLSSVGLAQLVNTVNVQNIINSVISNSATNYLGNAIFGKKLTSSSGESSNVSSDQNILANQVFGY